MDRFKQRLNEGVNDKMIAKLKDMATWQDTDDYKWSEVKKIMDDIDAAKLEPRRSAFEKLKGPIYDLPQNMKGYTVLRSSTHELDVYWALLKYWEIKERVLNKERKDAERAEIDARKAAKTGAKEAKAATVAKHLELPALKVVVDKVVEGFRQEIIDWNNGRMTSIIQKYFPKNIYTPPEDLKGNIWDKELQRKRTQIARLKETLRPFVVWGKAASYYDKKDKGTPDTLNKDWKKILQKQSEDMADQSVQQYKNKLSQKIGEVIDRKGGKAKITVSGSQMNHSIHIVFPDKSGFTIRTQQVLATSVLGKLFARWPTTFHNVTFSDGTTMKSPSSERLQAEFGISDLNMSSKD